MTTELDSRLTRALHTLAKTADEMRRDQAGVNAEMSRRLDALETVTKSMWAQLVDLESPQGSESAQDNSEFETRDPTMADAIAALNRGDIVRAEYCVWHYTPLSKHDAVRVVEALFAGKPEELSSAELDAYDAVVEGGFKHKSTGAPPRPYIKQVVQALGYGDTRGAGSALFDNTNLTQVGAELVTQALLAGSPDTLDDNGKRIYSLIVKAGFKPKPEPETRPTSRGPDLPVWIVTYAQGGVVHICSQHKSRDAADQAAKKLAYCRGRDGEAFVEISVFGEPT